MLHWLAGKGREGGRELPGCRRSNRQRVVGRSSIPIRQVGVTFPYSDSAIAKHKASGKRGAEWAEAKRRCRLSEEEVNMAKESRVRATALIEKHPERKPAVEGAGEGLDTRAVREEDAKGR